MDENDVLCPVCKAPMVQYGKLYPTEPSMWYCPHQARAVRERRPVGQHQNSSSVSVWTEARLDAWHSPA